nr:DEAD/DEAH box helicase family protein [Campylobacter anatolicus]
MKEYNKFQKDAVNSSSSANVLKAQLEDDNVNIIVTTIQKLNNFIKSNSGHEIFNKDVVIIFDECHRSQFGDMHRNIKRNFKKYYMFGFTGTPIFTQNIGLNCSTTEGLFGVELHNYTIVNAIDDKNVLPFKVSYLNTIKAKDEIKDKDVIGIDTAGALINEDRILKNSEYILEHFEAQTKNRSGYTFNSPQILSPKGFNSMLAVSNIKMAKRYYKSFKSLNHNLKVATIFSFAQNEDEDESSESAEGLDKSSREFLDGAISDYNAMFGTNYDAST